MHIFMTNISFDADELEITDVIAQRLHRPPFPTTEPSNFHVQLFKSKSVGRKYRHKHGGSGRLTVSSADIGELFLQLYGSQNGPTVRNRTRSSYDDNSIFVRSRQISFHRDTKGEDKPLILRIASQPWVNPIILRNRQAYAKTFSGLIQLERFSFGRFCENGTFSPHLNAQGSVRVFKEERKVEIRLDDAMQRSYYPGLVNMFALFGLDDFSLTGGTTTIELQFPVALIANVACRDSDDVMIELERSPVFTRTEPPDIFEEMYGNAKPSVARISSLKSDGSAMPPVGRSLCLSFASRQHRDSFLERLAELHAPRPIIKDLMVIQSDVYDNTCYRLLDGFAASLPFPLAFEVLKAYHQGVLEPEEITTVLAEPIRQLTRKHADYASKIFNLFVSTIDKRGSLESAVEGPTRLPVSTNSKRRRRKKKKADIPAPSDDAIVAVSEQSNSIDARLRDAKDDYFESLRPAKTRLIPTQAAIYSAYQLIITPSSQYCEGPLVDMSNSVLRRYGNHESFLRVLFQDEDRCGKLRGEEGLDIHELLHKRFRPFLVNGVDFAGRHYEFLGYSMSSLRESSFYFVTPFKYEARTMTAALIRQDLGDFSTLTHNPARLAARWGQAFSASFPSIRLKQQDIVDVHDMIAPDKTIFTDGCSPISRNLCREIWKVYRRSRDRPMAVPSAFQFRLGGSKGIVVQDPTIKGRIVKIRKSQKKFDAPEANLTFDICGTSQKPISCFLNRPLIAVLEHHGVPLDSFMNLQQKAITEAKSIQTSFSAASRLFMFNGLGSSFKLPSLLNNLKHVLALGLDADEGTTPLHHDLIDDALHAGTTHILREMKHRARIPVPDSFTLIGVSDEWNCLEEREVFARVVDDRRQIDMQIAGKIIITRSPQVHPGDVQFVRAVWRKELAHLANVVVFACKGQRSLPSCLGGGDLDGDIYNLILDESLHPPKGYTSTPGDYVPLPPTLTIHACTIEDVADFVINYMESDLLGYIAILHLRIADVYGLDCADCLKLAEHASHAVDFPKTGTPVSRKLLPEPPGKDKPDYLSGEGIDPIKSGHYYESTKALGHLFRSVPIKERRKNEFIDGTSIAGNQIVDAIRAAARRYGLSVSDLPTQITDTDEDKDMTREARALFKEYSEELLTIAKTHSISKKPDARLSEADLISGVILQRYPDHKKRRSATTDMNLQTQQLTSLVRKDFNLRSDEELEEEDYDFDSDDEDKEINDSTQLNKLKRAWFAWLAAEEVVNDGDDDPFGARSFGLIALGVIMEVIKGAQKRYGRAYAP